MEIVWMTTHEPNVAFLTALFEEEHVPVQAVYSPLDRFFDTALEQINNGAKVLIARGGAATELKRRVNVPVVDRQQTYMDFFDIMETAYAIANRFALIGWYGKVRGFDRFREAQGDNMYYVEMSDYNLGNDEARVDVILDEVRARGISLVIGGGVVVTRARKKGMQGIYVGLDRTMALEAAEEAQYLLRIAHEQEYRYETITSIFDCVNDGIAAVDLTGKLTNINNLARHLLNVPRRDWKEHRLEEYVAIPNLEKTLQEGLELSNQIVYAGELRLVLNAKPILMNSRIAGAVVTMQRVDSIQKMENKIRAVSIEKGLYAKKNFDDIVGSSSTMRRLKQTAVRYAGTDATVLITGESGTGKELFAQGIHNQSARRSAPFVALNCAALPESLIESELFGYVKGAFTGARNEGKQGAFELAHRGTLFLDEVSEISLSVQARLLRVLQEREITRIGDDRVISVDVRILAASNKNLTEEVEAGRFRSDLYYRLAVLPLHLAPLRERGDDVLEVMRAFLRSRLGRPPRLSPGACALLTEYRWPGNLRELSNVADRLSLILEGEVVTEEDVRNALFPSGAETHAPAAAEEPRFRSSRQISREMVLEALQRHNGNRAETAQALGISTTTLWRRLRGDAEQREPE